MKLEGLGVVNGIDLDAYAGLIWNAANRMSRRTRGRVSPEEFVGPGWEGLRGAAERFDPARGTAFGTLAFPRVRGAMLDYMRVMDWVPRDERIKRKVDGRTTRVQTDWTSIEAARGQSLDVHDRPPVEDPDDLARILFRPLKPRMRFVATERFVRGRSAAEIAREMGVSEVWVFKLLGDIRALIMPREQAEALVG